MRGDSIRDLYAKTLALLCLGVIAGAGALVDYWPVGISVPPVSTALSPASLPGPLSVAEVGVPAPAPAASARPAQSPATLARAARSRETRTAAAPAAPPARELPIAASANLQLATTVRLRQPDLVLEPEFLLARASDETSREAFPEQVPTLMIVGDVETPAGMPRARLAPADPETTGVSDEGDGLITGAFKKAGSSIASAAMTGAKTGARTGASIFDTFRIVSGLVGRVLPGR